MIHRWKAATIVATMASTLALAGATNANALNVGTLSTPVGSGSMPSTATAGASRFVLNGAVPLNCASTSLAASTVTGAYPNLPATIGTVQLQFGSCQVASIPTTVSCTNTTSHEVTNAPAGGVANGRFAAISCTFTLVPFACSATLSGTVPVPYTNPTASTAARATVQTAGQSLAVSGTTCSPSLIPNGSAQLGAPTGAGLGLSNLLFTLGGASSGHPFLS